MVKTVFYSKILKEKYYKYVLDNSLELYVYPKKDQRSNYAVFGTKFGSVHTDFVCEDGNEYRMPKGIAHFLEHKLFESEELDAFERFAETGAYSNAYTSFDKTCYLFSCTDNFYESYDILLDFVQSPFFTEQTVQKEQGIIGQEIKMYDDMGSWRVYMNALKGLYHNLPINVDITGTVEDISQITSKNLYECYDAFYNPSNMFICICGNVDEQEVLDFTLKRIKNRNNSKAVALYKDEPYEVCEKYISSNLVVSIPQFIVAFKNFVPKGKCISLKERIIMCILLSMIASQKTTLYNQLTREGLINAKFGTEVFDGPGYCSLMFSGESSAPQVVKDRICEEISRFKSDSIDVELFNMIKRELYGNLVMQFDDVENIVNGLVDSVVDGYDMFEYFDIINSISVQELEEGLDKFFDLNNMVLSVVEPLK